MLRFSSVMLEEIHISNFAIIDTQTVPFSCGFNVLSGETGAGKSILIDALGLQLGDRADSSWVRHGTSRCDIQSVYRFPEQSAVAQWLNDNEFDTDDKGVCQLRRTLSVSGQSRCYINAIPTTVSNTKQLGEMLVDIHGQHAHQSLTNPEKQLDLLDHFAAHGELLAAVKQAYNAWQKLIKQQKQLLADDSNLADKGDLLRYQLDELTALDLVADEFDELSAEQKRLAAANDILQQVNTIEQAIDGEQSVVSALNSIISAAEGISQLDSQAEAVSELFNQALIYADEGRAALHQYAQSISLDPERLFEIEKRMGQLHELARKHRVSPDDLLGFQTTLQQQLNDIDSRLKRLSSMDSDISKAKSDYDIVAKKLSDSRQAAAKRLQVAVEEKLALLNLGDARFSVVFNESNSAKANGVEQIVFHFSPNPGQGEKPLHKIASGGELSRISLAIQVAGIAEQSNATLIFDEVDSGIGGATAEIVGRLLKTLSQVNQVICVTHLAQVAAFADCHIEISKSVQDGETFTQFVLLNDKQRIDELARMSGGLIPDKKTREHAQKLRKDAVQFSHSLSS